MFPATVPAATHRLPFNAAFTFDATSAIVDCLDTLGISHCYTSSYFKAVPGSTHGYDVADPTQLNPEIGDRDSYDRWVDTLRAHDVGHIIDLVPHHMGIAHSSNHWWQDVLENGPSSLYATFFDIDWHPLKPELENKVLLPILIIDGESYPSRNEEYLLYRTLIGSWPFATMTAEQEREYRERIGSYMLKTMREAKVFTSWLNPSEPHEQAMGRFVDEVLSPDDAAFRRDFLDFAHRVARYGIDNSLAQLAIKIGAPRCYQQAFTGRCVPVIEEDGRPWITAADVFEAFPIGFLEAV